MDKNIIKCMLNDSTWKSIEKKEVYKFFNGNSLSINGKNHSHYSVNSNNDEIELQLGLEKRYNIEYVNDFLLKLKNDKDSYYITPE